MSQTRVKVHKHSTEKHNQICSYLQSLLPYSLTILRRIQNATRFSDQYVLLATFPPESVPKPGQHFAICIIDPTESSNLSAGCTAYLFSSLELDTNSHSDNDQPNGASETQTLTRTQNEISNAQEEIAVAHITAVLVEARHVLQKLSTYKPDNASIIKLAATNTTTVSAVRSIGEKVIRGNAHNVGGPYQKYIFSTRTARQNESMFQLPEGLVFDDVQSQDYDLVMANNDIVRSAAFLARLTSVALRQQSTGQIVAWAFSGTDGSVRTVHVMNEWRRKGLARAVILRLIEQDTSKAAEGDDRLQHVDISGSNMASLKLFKSLGATRAWDSVWLHVDLDALPD